MKQESLNLSTRMDTMIDQEIFALDMEALMNHLKRLEIQDKVVTLLNDLYTLFQNGGCLRRSGSSSMRARHRGPQCVYIW